MYRRVNSGGFIGAMTLGIVIVMALFTWVMYGMARQVYTMTDVMVEVNESFKAMVVDMHAMTENMVVMTDHMVTMTDKMSEMTGHIAAMDGKMGALSEDMSRMDANMGAMTQTIQVMNANISQLTMDVGRASYAFSNPMGYMFGNPFPF